MYFVVVVDGDRSWLVRRDLKCDDRVVVVVLTVRMEWWCRYRNRSYRIIDTVRDEISVSNPDAL